MFLRMSERTRLANLPLVYQSILLSQSTLTGTNLLEARARIAYACNSAKRRRKGRVPRTFEAFRNSRFRRVGIRKDVYARHQYRLGTAERLSGHSIKGTARIAWAAACGPRAALHRVVRVASQPVLSLERRQKPAVPESPPTVAKAPS